MIKGEKKEKKDENQHPEYLINMQILWAFRKLLHPTFLYKEKNRRRTKTTKEKCQDKTESENTKEKNKNKKQKLK